MKLPIVVLLCASSVVACSHESHPSNVPTDSTGPIPTQRVETAPADVTPQAVQEKKPESVLPGMPKDSPQVAPPAGGAAPPDETSLALTPASGSGSARTVSPQMVQTDPTRDKAETPQDQTSIREIRALLASDHALSPISSQVTIVVRGGRVWLRGQVNTAAERSAIEKAARRAGGVLDVKNELVVME